MGPDRPPKVSVIMPARNAAAHIDAAVASVLSQTLADLELWVIDDGSTDETATRVTAFAARDARVKLVNGPGRGPATARNMGLLRAAGRWVALMDADDVIEAGRLETLVRLAEGAGADLIADNLLAFYEDGRSEHPWLEGPRWQEPGWIDLETLLRMRAGEELGYLKPLLRLDWLRAHGLSYDESLRIGEDFDLIVRALAEGGRYRYVPDMGYRYRRHPGSISHRLEASQVAAMITAMLRILPSLPEPARTLAERRLQTMGEDRDFATLISDLKAGRYTNAGRALSSAGARVRLFRAVAQGLRRRLGLS